MDNKNKNQPTPPEHELNKPFKKLGSCCICQSHKNIRNIIFLNRKCIVRGHGWGCAICHLPPDGAVAVLCENCMKLVEDGRAKIKYAYRGYPGEDGRVPVEQLTEPHEHNHRTHQLYEHIFQSVN